MARKKLTIVPPSRWADTDLFVVRRSKIQGRGAFAARRIRKGQRIIEYIGRRISTEEADRKYADTPGKRHHTFLFTVDEHTVIDASYDYNKARYINHSCDPNCEAVSEDGHIFIEAIRNIQPGVELTYDYAFESDGPITEEDRRLYPCHCGSPKCRGTIIKPKRRRRKSRRSKRKKSR
ncbi:MAG: SET domain-containing protein-lysine N-methyltransferase [Candidatus Zixiibacteriota bacterium]|nr:MAG: SET domain-containing protein-lysine N-methyltransferase [candidate division Zixibacteria bacterium]